MHALIASLLSLLLVAPSAGGWLGVYLSTDNTKAVVSEVIPGTPAAKAGLRSGDVLLAVGDTRTPTREKFVAEVQKNDAGARVKIKVRRLKQELMVDVQLGDRPKSSGAGTVKAVEEPAAPIVRQSVRKPRPAPSTPIAEVAPKALESALDGERGYLGIAVGQGDNGVLIERVLANGPSAKVGLRSGDVLQSIGDDRIRSLADLDRVLAKVRPGLKVPVGVVSGDLHKSLIVKFGRRPAVDSKSSADAVTDSAKQAKVVGIDNPVDSSQLSRSASGARRSPPGTAERARSTAKSAQKDSFAQELKGLRKELQELRKMLEEIRRGKNGGE